MKNTLKYRLILSIGKYLSLVLCVFAFLSSCDLKNEEEEAEILVEDIAEINAALKEGEWKVTYFTNEDEVQTEIFDGMRFSFGDEDGFNGTDGTDESTGFWYVGVDEGDDHIHFDVIFYTPERFDEWSKEWDLMKFTEGKAELFSGNNIDTNDFLTFEKL